VYSVNIAAVAAIQAALPDLEYLNGYLRQVTESKALLYAACDRLGITYWKSRSNFVLVCAGDRTDALVRRAFAKGIYLRDRSTEPGCAGCLRIGTGIVDHTRRAIAVMEEVLCAAR
jgi:histidinol-phosphate aminotransferase